MASCCALFLSGVGVAITHGCYNTVGFTDALTARRLQSLSRGFIRMHLCVLSGCQGQATAVVILDLTPYGNTSPQDGTCPETCRAFTTALPEGANAPSSGDLACGNTVTGDTTGAQHVVGSDSGEHYYHMTVTSAYEYTFETCDGSAYDARLRLYTGSHLEATSEQIAENDDTAGCGVDGEQARIVIVLQPGMYTLVVEGSGSHAGTYTLRTTCGDAPVGGCTDHSACDSGFYCDGYGDCYTCTYCVQVENDAVDGTCPDSCAPYTTAAGSGSSGDLTCGSTVTGDTAGTVHAVGDDSGEHYYLVTVNQTQLYRWSCNGSEYSTQLRLYVGGGSHLEGGEIVNLVNHDDTCVFWATLEPGVYTLVVEGAGSAESRYVLHTTCSDLEPAAELTCGSIVTGDTTGAEHNVGDVSGEHFFRITVNDTQQFGFSTCEVTAFDTRLRLYTGSHLEAYSEQVANVDDSFGCGLQSRIVITLSPGTYTLVLEGHQTHEGAYTLTTSCAAVGDLTCGSTVTGDTTGAEHNVGDVSGEHFFRLNVGVAQQYSFSTCEGSSYDTRLRLYIGGHLETTSVEVVDVDDTDGCGLQSRITISLDPGLYTLIVEGYGRNEGSYTLETTCVGEGNDCSVHSDCEYDGQTHTYCDARQVCFACDFCVNAVENDAIDGACPQVCDGYDNGGTVHPSEPNCSLHAECDAGYYCDDGGDCYNCNYCVTVFNDAIDGTCPDSCGAWTTTAEPGGNSGGPTRCDGHDGCGHNGATHTYCDGRGVCFNCGYCVNTENDVRAPVSRPEQCCRRRRSWEGWLTRMCVFVVVIFFPPFRPPLLSSLPSLPFPAFPAFLPFPSFLSPYACTLHPRQSTGPALKFAPSTSTPMHRHRCRPPMHRPPLRRPLLCRPATAAKYTPIAGAMAQPISTATHAEYAMHATFAST